MTDYVAPTVVYRACLRGLKLHDRAKRHTLNTGATAASVSFAEGIADGFPIDLRTAAEVIEAHELLDQAPRHPDGEPATAIAARLLWGGDTAVDWCEQILTTSRQTATVAPTVIAAKSEPKWVDHVPVSIAATAQDDDLLEGLSLELFQIDETACAALRSAFWVAYRTALRSSASRAKSRTFRVPRADQIAAGLADDELNTIRAHMAEEGPLYAARALPDHLAAVIDFDLDQAVQSSLEDYEIAAAATLTAAVATATTVIARRLEVPRAQVEALAPSNDSVTTAAAQLSSDLLGWVRTSLDGTRDPEDLDELVVPEDAIAGAVATAGGGAPDDEEDSVGAPILDRVLNGVTAGRIAAAAFTAAVVTSVQREWEWVYGDPATRTHGPFPDHVPLDGARWTDETTRRLAVGDNRPRTPHRYCQCRIRRRWSLNL